MAYGSSATVALRYCRRCDIVVPDVELAGPGDGDPTRGAHSGTGVPESIGIVQSDPVIECMVLTLIERDGYPGLRRVGGHNAQKAAGAHSSPADGSRHCGSRGARASPVASYVSHTTAVWGGRSDGGGSTTHLREVANHQDHNQSVMAGVSHAMVLQSVRSGVAPRPQSPTPQASSGTTNRRAESAEPGASTSLVGSPKPIRQRGLSGQDEEWAHFSTVIEAYAGGDKLLNTFLLVLTVGCNVITNSPFWSVTPVTCVLIIAIYASVGVPGMDLNPALSELMKRAETSVSVKNEDASPEAGRWSMQLFLAQVKKYETVSGEVATQTTRECVECPKLTCQPRPCGRKCSVTSKAGWPCGNLCQLSKNHPFHHRCAYQLDYGSSDEEPEIVEREVDQRLVQRFAAGVGSSVNTVNMSESRGKGRGHESQVTVSTQFDDEYLTLGMCGRETSEGREKKAVAATLTVSPQEGNQFCLMVSRRSISSPQLVGQIS